MDQQTFAARRARLMKSMRGGAAVFASGREVLRNGDVHYEVVLDPSGRHAVWFTDAVREDLPASVARGVRMQVARPEEPVESLSLEIDEAGESWIAVGKPISGPDVIVSLGFEMGGEPHQIDLPFVPVTK